MKFEIILDMEAIGEDDTILVRDEFGEYPDSEYVPKSMYDKLRELVREMHMAYIDITNSYENSEMDAIFEYSTNPIAAGKELKDRCDTERHRFDEAMLELGIEAGE